MHSAEFRFYEELNDFLPPDRRKQGFLYAFAGTPAVKDAIEAQGVPHTEVDLILVNGLSVDFDYHLQPGDRVAVYPVFESLDIFPVSRVRPEPLRRIRFIADVHLGKLVRWLRLLGFDTLYRNDLADADIIAIALEEKRIILTRDLGLLKNKAVTHGYWVRTSSPGEQTREVIQRFTLLRSAAPFSRCLECNGGIEAIARAEAHKSVPPQVAAACDSFNRCRSCGRIYWRGSHHARLTERLKSLGLEPGA